MSRAFVTKTSFTAGELDPLLLGRLDLKAQEDGAAQLRNVVVHPTGGASRRPGLRFIGEVPGALRLVAFEGPDGGELVAFGPYRLDVIKHGAVMLSITDTLWGPTEIADLSHARWGDRLLLCHPGVPPKELVRNGSSGLGIAGLDLRDGAAAFRLPAGAVAVRQVRPAGDRAADPGRHGAEDRCQRVRRDCHQ